MPKIKKVKLVIPKNVQKLVRRRDLARQQKNWAESDRLRKEIENLGFSVEDAKDGTKVKK